MKKSTLVNEVSSKTSFSPDKIEKVVDTMLDIITVSLKEGESVSLYGFGSFMLTKRKAKEVYIPGTNKKAKVKARNIVTFKPSNRLKRVVEAG